VTVNGKLQNSASALILIDNIQIVVGASDFDNEEDIICK
jgi:hypothetical protein